MKIFETTEDFLAFLVHEGRTPEQVADLAARVARRRQLAWGDKVWSDRIEYVEGVPFDGLSVYHGLNFDTDKIDVFVVKTAR
jgi:hypothetical protein